jgi:hypothetical protein
MAAEIGWVGGVVTIVLLMEGKSTGRAMRNRATNRTATTIINLIQSLGFSETIQSL